MQARGEEEVDVPVGDGTTLGGLVVSRKAPGDAGDPVFVVWPALGVWAKYYRPLADGLCDAGADAVLFDLRGSGRSRPLAGRSTRYGYRELLTRDWPRALAVVRERFAARPVFLLGHSLGGQLSALYLALEPTAAAGLVLVATSTPYFRRYGPLGGVRVLVGSQLMVAVSRLLGYLPATGFGSRQAAGLIADWGRQARTGRYAVGGLPDLESRLGQVRLPVLSVGVDGDRQAPPRAVEHLCEKLSGAAVTRWRYGPAEAGAARLSHLSWVPHSGQLAARIRGWAGGVTEGRST